MEEILGEITELFTWVCSKWPLVDPDVMSEFCCVALVGVVEIVSVIVQLLLVLGLQLVYELSLRDFLA